MPKLLKQAEDTWAQAEPSVIEWKNLEQWQAGDPLVLAGDAEPSEAHTQASAIAIEFPAFNDGRGLSVAVLLRNCETEVHCCRCEHGMMVRWCFMYRVIVNPWPPV